ncbi:MAG: TIGR03619 family F420-dependent LLM class oxidoreductase [Trebonia sp.]
MTGPHHSRPRRAEHRRRLEAQRRLRRSHGVARQGVDAMLYGLNLPNYSGLGHHDAVTAIAERAEELGYQSLWTSDHILLPASLPDPYGNLLESLTTLSYLAGRTRRISLATGILVLPQRDPLLVAKQAATIHHLSEGRLTLGVGVGWIEQEYGYLRAAFDQRGKVADEYIAAIRALFQTDDPEYHGTWVDYSGVLFTPRPRTPLRIVVGGSSTRALRRAATLGDGWHGLHRTPQEVRAATAALDRYGRKPGYSVSLRTRTRMTRKDAERPDAAALIGTADQLAAQAEQYAEAGVDQLVIEPDAAELGDFLDQITRFADHVANRLLALSRPDIPKDLLGPLRAQHPLPDQECLCFRHSPLQAQLSDLDRLVLHELPGQDVDDASLTWRRRGRRGRRSVACGGPATAQRE